MSHDRFLLVASIMMLFMPFQNGFSSLKVAQASENRNQAAIGSIVHWNTFLGGNASDGAGPMTLDGNGNIYVVGGSAETWGSPVAPFEPACCGTAFVAKLDSSGNLLWNTFLGRRTVGNEIALDNNGNIYVTGSSWLAWGSPIMPFVTQWQSAFVAKLDSSGNLLWNTFLGDISYTLGNGISVDDNGYIYVTGSTDDDSWGNPLQFFNGKSDGFVAKLDASGNLVWNTFLGGSEYDQGNSIQLDTSGNIYVAGSSDNTWGNPIQKITGIADLFIAKLNASGTLTWNTFLNKSKFDRLNQSHLAVDGSGNAYVAGTGTPLFGGTTDAIVIKLDTAGNQLWNTMLAGNGDDNAYDMALDSSGNAYVVGNSKATWGNPVEPFGSDGNDGFIARINANGLLAGSTFIDNAVAGIAMGANGNIYLSGSSATAWGNPLRAYSADNDAFVAEVSFHIISGSTEIEDVTLSYTDGTAKTIITNSNGDYTFGVSDGWTGTVTSSDGSHTFTPASKDYNNLVTDQTDQNYAPVEFFITGNTGIAGATLSYDNGGPQTTTTDDNGDYAITVPNGWTGTIIPSKTGVIFFPSNRQYPNLTSDEANQNYNITGQKLVSAGGSHTCGIQQDNSVYCWGDNDSGQSTPPAGSFGQISAGNDNTCGIKLDGTLTCWGHNESGQSNAPTGTFTQVGASEQHACAVKTDETVVCWGANYYGQSTPPSGRFVQVSTGSLHTCGLKANAKVVCWGNNSSNLPSEKFKQISTGWEASCGLKTDGKIICWNTYSNYYLDDLPNENFIRISMRASYLCGMRPDGTVSCWGNNIPSFDGTYSQISAGYAHICTVNSANLWDCQGDNSNGQLYPYSISGTTGEPEVNIDYKINNTNLGTTTDVNGNYSFGIPDGWSGVVTPSKTHYAFTPVNINYPPLVSNQINQNYTTRVTFAETGFESIGTQDGWILESSENSNTGGSLNAKSGIFQLGDDANNRQYRAILSFDTSPIPDNATIKSAAVWMSKIGTIVGANPFNILGRLLVDIRTGPFGNNAALQLLDFRAPASATNVGGKPNNMPLQVAFALNATGRSKINKTGLTQLRLYFTMDDNNNNKADYIKFISGSYNQSIYRPFIIIDYTMP